MRTMLVAVIAGVALLYAPVSVRAHHAFAAEFDVNKPMTLHGTLEKWEMINPPSWFHIAVKNPDGTIVTWMIEGASPHQLLRLGVTTYTIPTGTELALATYGAQCVRTPGGGATITAPGRRW